MIRIKTLLVVVALLPTGLLAQEDAKSPKSKLSSKFSFHGFLTQAYAFREGGSEQVLGIPDNGTADYRNIALQGNYTPTGRDRFVLQLSNTRLGDVAFQDFRDDIEVDWAFYQRDFTNGLTARLGRVPIPIGIYNEIRDVGTLLPFHTPPQTFYLETEFSHESIDGIVLSRHFFPQASWGFSLDAYTGGWDQTEVSGGRGDDAKVRDAVGAQIWLLTPVEGLRFGAGANTFNVSEGLRRAPGAVDTWRSVFFSADGNFQRFLIRSELNYRKVPFNITSLGKPSLDGLSFYVQAGYYVTSKVRFYAQYDSGKAETEIPFLGSFEGRFWEDTAVSVHYAVLPRVLLKAEYHDNRGFFRENVQEERTFFLDPPYEGDYGIFSVATSF